MLRTLQKHASTTQPHRSTLNVRLPTEMWIEVFTCLHADAEAYEGNFARAQHTPKRTHESRKHESLAAFSLTCREFYNLALPIRFRSVRLIVRIPQSELDPPSVPNEIFRRLSISPYLQNMVKTLHMTIVDGTPLPSFPEIVAAMVFGMHNIEQFKLNDRCQMTPASFAHLCSLRHLQRLEVDIPYAWPANDAEISASFDPDETQICSGLAVSANYEPRFALGGASEPEDTVTLPPSVASIVLSSIPKHLHLWTRLIRLPFIDYPTRRIPAAPLQLESLQIGAPQTLMELDDLKHFAAAAPLISTIILDRPRSESDWHNYSHDPFNYSKGDISFPSRLFPSLRHYTGPWMIARALVPGRPVKDITINAPIPSLNDGRDQFYPLSMSSATVRSLVLPRNETSVAILEVIADLFPKLEELELSLQNSPERWETWLFQDLPHILDQFAWLQRFTLCCLSCVVRSDRRAEVISQLALDRPLHFIRLSFHPYPYPAPESRSADAWTKRDGEYQRLDFRLPDKPKPFHNGDYDNEPDCDECNCGIDSYSSDSDDDPACPSSNRFTSGWGSDPSGPMSDAKAVMKDMGGSR